MLQMFILENDVEHSDSLINREDFETVRKALDMEVGTQLQEYILKYGYLAFKFSELYGVNARQLLDSDMVSQTLYLRNYYPETAGLAAIENLGEGDYYLVDANDLVFEFDVEMRRIIPTGKKLFEYIFQRFESIRDIC